jgi:prepilin-type N-terminal cleavage/methylation domain-containing protein
MDYGTKRGQDGFTLVEQIMVMLIAAVILTIAVPSMHGFIRKHRLQSAQMDYIAGLRYARDVAATRGVRTIFCPSRDNRTCQGAWSEGWLVGLDPDAKGQPADEPLHVGGNDIPQLNVLGSDSKKTRPISAQWKRRRRQSDLRPVSTRRQSRSAAGRHFQLRAHSWRRGQRRASQ